MDASCISYKETGYFSSTVIDYLENKPELRPYYSYRPDLNGFKTLLQNKKVIADRDILAKVLLEQYQAISQLNTHNSQQVRGAIELLKSPDTYT
ncbi:MAG: bacillithiol biosynthesis BshC, partial [Mucilaginibacter sp.]